MDPSESFITPDLVLTANRDLKKTSGSIIKNLKIGDEIAFTAKLIDIGNESRITHAHVIKIERTDNFKELEDIIVLEHQLPTALPDNHDQIMGEYEQELVNVDHKSHFDGNGNLLIAEGEDEAEDQN